MKKVTIDGVAYTLTDEPINVDGYEIDENSTTITYAEIADGDELTIGGAINPENDQKLIHGIIHTADEDDTCAEMFLALTDRYYDWTSETADMYDAMSRCVEDGEADVEEMDNVEADYLAKASKITHSSRDIMDEAQQHVLDARENAMERC